MSSLCDLKCSGNEVCQFEEDTSKPGSTQLTTVCKVPTYNVSNDYNDSNNTNHLNLIIISLVVFGIVVAFLGFIFFYKLRKKRQLEALHKENRMRVMIQMMKEPIPSISESESYDFSLLPYYNPNNMSILNDNNEASRSFQSIIYMNPSSTTSPQESRLSSNPPPSAKTTDSYLRVSSQYYSTYQMDLEKMMIQGTSESPNLAQDSKESK